MRLNDFLMTLLRRWWLIALCVIVTTGSAALLSSAQTPVYRSTQKVLLQPSRSDFGLAQTSGLLLEPAVVYLDSSLRAQAIIDALRLDMLAETLMEDVYIGSDSLTRVVQIDVDSTDIATGERIAAAWGGQLVDFRDEQNQQARREDRVLAILPDVPQTRQIAPTTLINVGAGALLGLIVGVLLVILLDFLESAVLRRRDDVERGLGLRVLASIPARENSGR
jgi:capsular polysaccharide biosynthesis protein